MSLIEWTCICIPITILSLKKLWFTYTLSFANNEIVSLHTCGTNSLFEDSVSLQLCLILLTVTSIISLVIILIFENDAINVKKNNKSNTHHNHNDNNKRGLGLVIGSHLVPLCYMVMYLFSFIDRDNCTTIKEDHSPSYDSTSKGLDHLQFASLGGLSFALSILWMKLSQYNHSKCNINRYESSDNVSEVTNGQVKETKLYEATAMSMCWKIYSVLLIVVCYTRCVLSSSGCDGSTILFGLIHIMLIVLYDQQNPQTQCKEHQQTLYQKQEIAWQDAFTFGEWNAIATLITSLVGEYIVEYIYNSKEGVTSISTRLSLPTHIVVAHAGLVGCLVGVALCSFVKLVLSNNVQKSNIITTRTIGMSTSLVIVVGVTVGCLEVALKSNVSEDAFCGIDVTPSTANNIINWVLLPLSVQWILHFLSSGKDMPSFSGSNTISSRVLILGYWIALLAICLPLSSVLMSWITSKGTGLHKATNENTISEDINNHTTKERKKRVIIARKYFHFVAILLFTPITYLDPNMMSLSYAIAISFLIVLEMIRGWIDSNIVDSTTHWNNVYTTFLDEKDTRGGLVVSHIALILGCAIPLWITQLLSRANDVFKSGDNNMLFTLLPYLGITVLGVGDSAAAIGGIQFGRHNWPGESSRTLEGSCCMFLSMMVVVLTMGTFMDSANITSTTIATMGVISLLEASTIQIDNFVLPLAGLTLVLFLNT